MKSKMTITILIGSFIGAALVLLIVFAIMLSSGALSRRTAGIAVPSEGGYIEAWTQHLPQISRTVNIPEVTIYTYDSIEKLESFFLQPEKYNLLWAEIPVSGEYNLKQLCDKIQLESFSENVMDNYPPALYKVVNNLTPKIVNNFIPISYNPWIVIKNAKKSTNSTYQYSIGANNEDAQLTSLALAKLLNSSNNYYIANDTALLALKQMSNDKTLIINSKTYTQKDALNALEIGLSDKAILPIYYFNNLSVTQRMELSILPFESTMVCDATIALFPVRKSEEFKNAVKNAQNLLLDPEIMYATANSRNWMPAHIRSVSRSVYTDYIKKQARQVKNCLIPYLQCENSQDKKNLLMNIQNSLSSDYSNQ